MTEKKTLVQPRTPLGVVEFLPSEQIAFERMMDVIRKGYQRFGFMPIETPVFELASVLLTKEGGETEKQVLFVQSTGSLKQGEAPELALHFDQTVPLARYVAEHEHKLTFPFRRYQMQKVYRGERPQRGRWREFYQCDIDIIGKDELSIHHDAELPAIIYGIFTELGLTNVQIQFNNRKLLKGLLEGFGIDEADAQKAVLHEIDRLDKIGAEAVQERLVAEPCNLSPDTASDLLALLGLQVSNSEKLATLKQKVTTTIGQEGLAELETVYQGARALGVPEAALNISLTTVRGLDYYTGTVYETLVLDDPKLGSICSGGRYENLAGLYTKSHLPGVGISIGASRLFLVLQEKGLIKTDDLCMADVLILQVETDLMPEYFALATHLRAAGLRVEVYVDPHKLGKQLKYADRLGAPYAVLMGGDEKARGTVTLKNLKKAEQEEIKLTDLPVRLKALQG